MTSQVALVTGVSRKIGIGAAIARTFAEAGIAVFTTYYRPYDELMPWGSSPNEPQEIIEELRTLGIRAEGVEADLADPEIPSTVIQRAYDSLGFVDILVNNASHDVAADIYSLLPASLDMHYAVNVRGALLLCAEFAKRHDGRTGGRVINLSSGQGLGPMAGNLPYAATKGAVEAFTLSLSVSLASKGITVNAVDPGPTDTGWLSDGQRTELIEGAPFGRIGTPADVAQLVLFLASSKGQWITGQVIHSRG